MSDFSITINDNGLSAQLILASNDSTPSKEDILKKCKDLKISNGIDIDLAIEQLESSSVSPSFLPNAQSQNTRKIFLSNGVLI